MAQVQFSTFLILRRTDRLDLTCCVVRLERFAVGRPETNGALSVLKVDVIAAFHVIEVLDGATLPVQLGRALEANNHDVRAAAEDRLEHGGATAKAFS